MMHHSIQNHTRIRFHQCDGEFAKKMFGAFSLILRGGPGQGLGKPVDEDGRPLLPGTSRLYSEGTELNVLCSAGIIILGLLLFFSHFEGVAWLSASPLHSGLLQRGHYAHIQSSITCPWAPLGQIEVCWAGPICLWDEASVLTRGTQRGTDGSMEEAIPEAIVP